MPPSTPTRHPKPDELIVRPPHLPPALETAVLPIDKPAGWTSFDVIRKLRRITRIKKIGHAGTLDPMATGLLVCLIGRPATRLMDYFQDGEKIYRGTMRLGETTPSYDAETEVDSRADASGVTAEAMEAVRHQFIGDIIQHTPMYSAVKVGGERLYKKARRGEIVPRLPRSVTIHSFVLTGQSGPDISFEVHCSKGTYIRSLAHEFGQALGVGAHLTALRRTGSGNLTEADCWDMDQFASTFAAQSDNAAAAPPDA